MDTRIRNRRARKFSLVVALAVAAPAVSWLGAGAATGLPGFTATASAQAGRASFHVPGFAVVEEIVDAGGPVSQSAVDPVASLSYAAMPYPGDLVISGPGLFAGLSGLPSPGNYPFYVSASHPTTPEQSLGDAGAVYHLLAKAGPASASGLAKVRGEAGESVTSGARAVTSAVVEGDTVTVAGESVNEGLNLGSGALRIGSVRSRSVTTYKAGDAAPLTRTEFTVDGGAAGASNFGYGPAGLVVAGQGVPIPTGSALEQLNTGLAPAGIAIRFVGAENIVGGASADALEITLAGQAPIPGTPPGIITLRFGGATSAITLGQGSENSIVPPVGGATGGGDASIPGDTPGPPGSMPPVTPADPHGDDGATASGAVQGATGSGPFFPTGGLAGTAGLIGAAPPFTDATGAAGETAAAGGGSAAAQLGPELAQPILQPRTLDADGVFYWVLIGTAILMLLGATLWRGKGVLSL
jgi:hypothetical protein